MYPARILALPFTGLFTDQPAAGCHWRSGRAKEDFGDFEVHQRLCEHLSHTRSGRPVRFAAQQIHWRGEHSGTKKQGDALPVAVGAGIEGLL